MKNRKLLLLILSVVLVVGCVGCVPLRTEKEGTAYKEADIDRKKYASENPVAEKEMADLIAEAEATIKAMGEVVPKEDRAEMDAVVENKEKMKQKIKDFLDKYPDVELDTSLPEVEISKEAFTWINELLKELEEEKNNIDNNEENKTEEDYLDEDTGVMTDSELGKNDKTEDEFDDSVKENSGVDSNEDSVEEN